MDGNEGIGSLLGRLLAIVEATEAACKVSMRDEGETVCGKQFPTASKTPQFAYPEILRAYYASIKIVRRNNEGRAILLDSLFDEISNALEERRIPKSLNEAEQCDFFIAYRLQRREFKWMTYGKAEV